MKNLKIMKIWLLIMGMHNVRGQSKEALFITEPASKKVILGESIRLNCKISGIPKEEQESSVQWTQNTFALGLPPLRVPRFFQSNGPTDYSLLIENAQLDDSGAYECQAHTATNRLRSQSARLEVLKPPTDVSMVPVPGSSAKLADDDVIEVIEGVETKLQCVASASKPRTEVDWIFQDSRINGSETVSGSKTFTTVSETVIVPNREDHGRTIICRANHEALQSPIDKRMKLNVKTKPDITVSTPSLSYREGDTIKVFCDGDANPPISSFAWKVNDQQLEGERQSILEIKDVMRNLNGATVTCQAQNEIGMTSSKTQLDIKYAPDIIGTANTRLVVNASDTATLSCNFDGNPIPTVTWYKNDLKIDSKNGDLKLENVDQMATGEYKCEGRSELGRAESSVQLVVRGPPIITSESDQFGNVFSCGYISEPGLESIQIIDMDAEDVNESIVYESADVTSDVVKIEPGTGRYECKVTNSLGTTTKFIVLHPQGVSSESKIAIIVSMLILLVIFGILIVIRLKFYPRERRFKVAKSVNDDENNDLVENKHSRKDSLLLGYDQRAEAVRSTTNQKARRASDEIPQMNDKIVIQHPHLQDGLKFNQTVSTGNLLGAVIIESSSSDRSHSGNDDGYGTESGSNHKDHSSQSESNSDYEINVPTVEESGSEYSKIRVKVGPDSLLDVMDGSGVSYQPQNIRSQTEKIQYQNFILSASKMNRVRSVSHV